jgi:hypothetical protein
MMSISLYDASVASYVQTATAVAGFLERGLSHCVDNGTDPEALVQTRLFPDMAPLRFQVVSVAHHSIGAIEGIKSGVFGPPSDKRDHDFAGLQKVIADALTALKALTPEEVNAFSGKDVVFQIGERRVPFTAEGFLLSFSLPNFHFHATTSYDILRSQGVPLGKRDYMGPLRIKT